MTIKKGDFVEVEYTGRIQENNLIFDTTSAEVAKKEGFEPEGHAHFGPVVVVIGERHLLQGLDEGLEGKELGSYKFVVPPEKGFGKKSAELLKLIPGKSFKKENVQPYVGMEITMGNNMRGTVRNVSGGRVIVDFNHPLAGKDLAYELKANRIITDAKEKILGLGKLLHMHMKEVAIAENEATITYEHELPEPLLEQFNKEIERLVHVRVKKTEEKPKNSEDKESKDQKTEIKPKKEKKETTP